MPSRAEMHTDTTPIELAAMRRSAGPNDAPAQVRAPAPSILSAYGASPRADQDDDALPPLPMSGVLPRLGISVMVTIISTALWVAIMPDTKREAPKAARSTNAAPALPQAPAASVVPNLPGAQRALPAAAHSTPPAAGSEAHPRAQSSLVFDLEDSGDPPAQKVRSKPAAKANTAAPSAKKPTTTHPAAPRIARAPRNSAPMAPDGTRRSLLRNNPY